jgi:hypothetical protein
MTAKELGGQAVALAVWTWAQDHERIRAMHVVFSRPDEEEGGGDEPDRRHGQAAEGEC